MSGRPIPLLGDIALESIQRIEHTLDAGFAGSRIVGLEGELQQRTGRPSHEIRIAGILAGGGAPGRAGHDSVGGSGRRRADVFGRHHKRPRPAESRHSSLQGRAGRWRAGTQPLLSGAPRESTSSATRRGQRVRRARWLWSGRSRHRSGRARRDAETAGEIAGAVETAVAAVSALGDIAGLVDGFKGVMDPLQEAVDGAKEVGEQFRNATRALGEAFG